MTSRLRPGGRILRQSPLRLLGITGDREGCAPAYSREASCPSRNACALSAITYLRTFAAYESRGRIAHKLGNIHHWTTLIDARATAGAGALSRKRSKSGVAAPSGASAISHDCRRYALGHVICADADALQARPPSNGR